jgi:GNAT superfamily N-acetyltransferase
LALKEYNSQNCKWFKNNISMLKEHNFFAFDNDKLVGGAVGFIKYNWYYLDLLYIDKNYRGKKIATNLIKKIEEFSKKNNLTGVRMETWDFQAKDFYRKVGYTIFGTIEDCPPGTIEYHLMKKIN